MIFSEKTNPHSRYNVELSEINKLIREDVRTLVDETDKYYQNQIELTAEEIENSHQHIVLLSGPSGSGKTTTAGKLKEELSRFGKTAHVISLDNFFRGKGRYPKLPDGRDDFESVYALDLELIRTTISDMLDNGYASMPRFDFALSEKIDNAYGLEVGEKDIVIFEGIHALNPILLPENHGKDAHKIYVSPKCQIVDDGKTLISSKTLRLTRRMIRDYKFRNYLHQQTVAIWDNVIDGERKNITPFADTADSVIDTTHFYEYGLYGKLLETLEHRGGLEKQLEVVQKIKEKYDRFSRVDTNLIKREAMIREFIG